MLLHLKYLEVLSSILNVYIKALSMIGCINQRQSTFVKWSLMAWIHFKSLKCLFVPNLLETTTNVAIFFLIWLIELYLVSTELSCSFSQKCHFVSILLTSIFWQRSIYLLTKGSKLLSYPPFQLFALIWHVKKVKHSDKRPSTACYMWAWKDLQGHLIEMLLSCGNLAATSISLLFFVNIMFKVTML